MMTDEKESMIYSLDTTPTDLRWMDKDRKRGEGIARQNKRCKDVKCTF